MKSEIYQLLQQLGTKGRNLSNAPIGMNAEGIDAKGIKRDSYWNPATSYENSQGLISTV